MEKGKHFEDEVADIYRMLGYEVERNIYICGKKVDIYATYSLPLTGNRARIIVECKNWKNKHVGNELILQFKGLIEIARKTDEADYAEFVTTDNYSDYAKNIAQEAKINLLTYKQLLSKLIDFTQNLKLYREEFQRDPLYKNYILLNFYKLEETALHESIECKESKKRISIEKYLDVWIKSKSSNYIGILADYGMGKTSLCKYFTYIQTQKYLNDPENERIPILINLKEFYKRFEIESMVTNFLVNRCGIPTNYLVFRKLLQLGKAVVILDGFDEMAQQVDREVRKRNFEALAELGLPNNKVIITGRPNYFVNKAEMEEILNRKREDDIYKQIASELVDKPIYEIVYLELFDENQIDQFLEKQGNYLKSKGISDWSELRKTINKTYNLAELAKRPFLLDMIIKAVSRIKGKVTEINAGKLYDIFTSEWLDRDYRKGEFTTNTGKWEDSLKFYSKSLEIFEKAENLKNQLLVLNKIGEVYYLKGDYKKAVDIFEKVLEKQDKNDFYGKQLALRNIGKIYLSKGNHKKGLKLFRQALDLNKILGNRAGVASCVFNIASVHYTNENYSESLEHFKNVLTICQELRDRRGESNVLKSIGQIYYAKGDHDRALELSEKALVLAKSLRDKLGESQILRNIGRLYYSKGDEDKAQEVFENALAIARELGHKLGESQILRNIGQIYYSKGHIDKALEVLENALAIAKELGHKLGECQVLENIGNIYNLKRDLKKAGKLNKEALKIKKELGNSYESFRRLENIGEIDYSGVDNLIVEKKEAKTEAKNIKPVPQVKNKILLVESNKDVRKFIRDALEKLFKVEIAADGQRGIGKAKEIIPDLIISNIMIPGVNGYELCHNLKSDIDTSHIPIILLSAEESDEVIIKGLEAGADDTITKLINIKILCARIKNLIEQRRQLQLKIQRQKMFLPAEIDVSSLDERFLKKFQEIIEKNLSDPYFNIEELCKQLCMARFTLFRKVQAMTGDTPNQFILSYRLERAAQLLRENFGNVTEVAFKVGFSNSAYFTKCFKDMFHQLPSTYLEAESKSKSSGKNIQTEKNENGDEV